MKNLKTFIVLFLSVFFLSGCLEEFTYDDTALNSTLEIVKSLADANTASAPVNPYSIPIGVGLTGIVAMLEALRRKEKAGRKFAENNDHAAGKT